MPRTTPAAQAENKSRWRVLKGRVIGRWGSISEAAREIGCHPESIRLAAYGLCPQVLERLEAELAKRESPACTH